MRPVDVLAAADRAEVDLIEPTRHTLSALTEHDSVDDVFATEVARRVRRRQGTAVTVLLISLRLRLRSMSGRTLALSRPHSVRRPIEGPP